MRCPGSEANSFPHHRRQQQQQQQRKLMRGRSPTMTFSCCTTQASEWRVTCAHMRSLQLHAARYHSAPAVRHRDRQLTRVAVQSLAFYLCGLAHFNARQQHSTHHNHQQQQHQAAAQRCSVHCCFLAETGGLIMPYHHWFGALQVSVACVCAVLSSTSLLPPSSSPPRDDYHLCRGQACVPPSAGLRPRPPPPKRLTQRTGRENWK